MLVLKFGGSCLAETADFRRAATMIAARLRRDSDLIVVVSAGLGATDALLEGRVEEQIERHLRMLDELGGRGPGLPEPEADDPEGVEAAALGERLALAVMTAAMLEIGLDPEIVEPGDLGLLTDADPWGARPRDLPRTSVPTARPARAGLVLVPGFYGNEAGSGRRRILGRNSSDLSAVFFAARCGAARVEIVSRARALMTADPLFLPAARPIPQASLAHLEAISRAGSPVVHREAIALLMASDIELVLHGLESASGSIIRRDVVDDPGLVTLVHHEGRDPGGSSRRRDGERQDPAPAGEEGVGTITLVGPGVRSMGAGEDGVTGLLERAGIPAVRVLPGSTDGRLRLSTRSTDLRAAAAILHEAFCRPRPSDRS